MQRFQIVLLYQMHYTHVVIDYSNNNHPPPPPSMHDQCVYNRVHVLKSYVIASDAGKHQEANKVANWLAQG